MFVTTLILKLKKLLIFSEKKGDKLKMIDNKEYVKFQELNTQNPMGIARSEVDIQISTARAYPRSIELFQQRTLQLSTIDEETAESMFYVLPRAGKKLEGPSVRLAEIAAAAWTNLRYKASIIDVGAKYITAQGMAWDLETNSAVSVEVKRRITDKHGQRFSDDMIQVTGNAACSIALRNAIFKVIPFSYVKKIYETAKTVSLGKNEPMEKKRQRFIDKLGEYKLSEADILKIMNREKVDELTPMDLINLKGIYTALKEGDTSRNELLYQQKHGNSTKGSSAERVKATKEASKNKSEASEEVQPEHSEEDKHETIFNLGPTNEDGVLEGFKESVLDLIKKLNAANKSEEVNSIKRELEVPQMITDITDIDQAQELFNKLKEIKIEQN